MKNNILNHIKSAYSRIQPYVTETPILENSRLNQDLGFRLFLKAENLQVTGSFKIRGALNQILSMDKNYRGVIAASSGNHGHAVAYAAMLLKLPATILMPKDAPKIKIENVRQYGAKIIFYDRRNDNREKIAKIESLKSNLFIIKSSNHDKAIFGQATVGLEINSQLSNLKITPDTIITNCCGGGLAAGIALTRNFYKSPPDIYTAEPSNFNDMKRSLEIGQIVRNNNMSESICDALLSAEPSIKPFSILLDSKVKGMDASEFSVKRAMKLVAENFKMIAEPSGVVSIACLLENKRKFKDKTVIVIISGGNVEMEYYKKVV